MQSTNDVAALLGIPPASVRRIKQEMGLTEDFHFIKQGNRLLWTVDGTDVLSTYVHENPFIGLLEDESLWDEDMDEAA